MTLKDTVAAMSPEYYKESLAAEYWQTKIRYEDLHRLLVKYDEGKLEFTPNFPIDLLREQEGLMVKYLYTLEVRAEIEGISLICMD